MIVIEIDDGDDGVDDVVDKVYVDNDNNEDDDFDGDEGDVVANVGCEDFDDRNTDERGDYDCD